MGQRENRVAAGTLLFAAGAILGAGIALLVAPKSGKDTRKYIVRYAKKARNGAEGVVDEFTDIVSGMVDAVGEGAEDILDKGKDLSRDAKKGLIEAIVEGQRKLEKQKSRLEKMIA